MVLEKLLQPEFEAEGKLVSVVKKDKEPEILPCLQPVSLPLFYGRRFETPGSETRLSVLMTITEGSAFALDS